MPSADTASLLADGGRNCSEWLMEVQSLHARRKEVLLLQMAGAH